MKTLSIQKAEKENMMITFILWLVFGGIAMVLMLYVANSKTIVIANVEQEQSGIKGTLVNAELGNTGESEGSGFPLVLEETQQPQEGFRIPLPAGLKAEDVTMENRYMEQALWIYIHGADADFFADNAVEGRVEDIRQGICEARPEELILKLQMNGIYEYQSTMEGNALLVTAFSPGEVYDKIVVIDPVGGGSDKGKMFEDVMEKDIALQVAKMLQQQTLAAGYKLYFTRLTDAEVTQEARAELAEGVNADMFIELGVNMDVEASENYGIEGFYNEEYFIPEFGNVQLADAVTRNVTITASNRAVGLAPIEDKESSLWLVGVPAMKISLGYLTNEQERKLLEQDTYLEKLAEGIANAMEEVYTDMDKTEE